jgi:hypothetical protein
MTLFELSEQDRLIADSLEESGGELTPEIEELLAETRDLFPKKVDGYGVMIRKFKSLEDTCKTEIERVERIKRVAQNAQKNIRNHILDAMVFFGYQKLEGNMTTFRLGKSKSLEVDEDALLAQYKEKIDALQAALPPYLTVEVKVSKKGIKDAFPDGVLPAGCEVKENNTITIK